ncbi:hypothetical protein FRC12_000913 [Ceratobasidium sp. 428]|nr:hypothetical protein FRC12_000913 [Ceratobasidium sp. 428]
MGDSYLHFPSRNPTPPLSLEFAFTNPGTSQSKQARDRISDSNSSMNQHQNSHNKMANAATADQPFFKATKPGPLTGAEFSSGTNAFRLRANKPQTSPSPSNNPLLRQEVFKFAHTSTPSQPPGKFSADAFPATRRVVGSTTAPLEPSNKPSSKPQLQLFTAPVATSSHMKFEPSPRSSKLNARDVTGSDIDTGIGYMDHSVTLSGGGLSSATPSLANYRHTPDADLVEPVVSVPSPKPLQSQPHEYLLPPKTPSRRSRDRDAPTCGQCSVTKAELQDIQIKCDGLVVERDTKAKHAETYSNLLQQERQQKAQAEEALRDAQSQLTEMLEHVDELQKQIKDLHEHSSKSRQLSAELAGLKQDIRDANTAIERSQAISEGKRGQLQDRITEYQSLCEELKIDLRQQQGVSDLLRDELSQVRGNYSESLERNTELQGSLIAMANEHTEGSKSLASLQHQLDDLTIKCSELRASESSATDRAKNLELSMSSLTSDNSRIQSLLAENERAFTKELKHLEAQNDSSSHDLKIALTELATKNESLESLRSAHDETLVQLEVHRREESEAKERVLLLVQDVELKSQSLNETRKINEASVARLAETERNLTRAGEEISNLKGRIAELEKVREDQAMALNLSQTETVRVGGELFALRGKLAEATAVCERIDSLEQTLSRTESKLECQNVELTHLKQQLAHARESHSSQITERDSLLGKVYASGERETQLKRELQVLRDQVGQYQESTQRANAELVQVRGLRQAAEQKLKDSMRTLDALRVEQKDKMQGLKVELSTQQAEVKRLGSELSACTSAKKTLDGVLSDFRTSTQQEIATLTAQASDQKARSSSLEQQIASTNARCLEYKAEANVHRAEAENTRASMTLIEHRFKEKELELNGLRSKVQELESVVPESTVVTDSVLQARVSEQEATISNLNSEVSAMKKSAETVLERYRTGKLSDHEKDFITEVTAGLNQDKNKAMYALRGEIKRKDNELAAHKSKIAEVRESLAKQIQRADTLSAQLEGMNGDQDPTKSNNLLDVMKEMHHMPSSSLSEAPAPDHDEPAPDTPTVKAIVPPPNARQSSLLTEKQRPQQYRTFADLDRSNSNGLDEIQEFEESERAPPGTANGRKRRAANIEPTDDSEMEQVDSKRKGAAKTKKAGKTADSNTAAKDASHTVNTRGKAGKRRKG